jgi:hypothetical protein
MNTTAIVASIINRLAPLKDAGYEVERMPEKQSEYSRPFEKGRVTIYYNGSTFLPVNSTSQSNQTRKVNFALELRTRTMYNDLNGIHTLRSSIERLLTGFKPLNCSRLYLLKDEPGKFEENDWVHLMEFETTTLLVMAFSDEEADGALLNPILFSNEFDTDNGFSADFK